MTTRLVGVRDRGVLMIATVDCSSRSCADVARLHREDPAVNASINECLQRNQAMARGEVDTKPARAIALGPQ